MTAARATRTPLPATANAAGAHARVDGRVAVVPSYTGINTAPAGAIMAGAADLARWLVVQLDSGRLRSAPDDRRLWSQRRQREMWTGVTVQPVSESPGALAAFTPSFAEYALGWQLRDYRGHKLATHTGSIVGMTSRTVLVPEAKVGVVVLTNAESTMSTAVAWEAIDALLGAPRTRWVEAFAAADRADREEADSVERAARTARDSTSRPSLALARYAGRYTDRMYGDATLAAEGGRLVLRFVHSPALIADLAHWQHDTFVARWRQRNVPDAYVSFALDPRGAVESMKMVAVSPLADFSFDFQDLLFVPAAAGTR